MTSDNAQKKQKEYDFGLNRMVERIHGRPQKIWHQGLVIVVIGMQEK